MKEINKYSRAAAYLSKLYDMLNTDLFDGQLERPVITIQSTPAAFGHVSIAPVWTVKGEPRRELNIGAGTLSRPIENTIATLVHEMAHIYNMDIAGVQDCSGSSRHYHNKHFKQAAETHGLIVTRSDKYGWSHTEPGDMLLKWLLENNIQDIMLTRHDPFGVRITGGATPSTNGGVILPPTAATRPHNYRWECPCCHAVARSGKPVRLICGDCLQPMT